MTIYEILINMKKKSGHNVPKVIIYKIFKLLLSICVLSKKRYTYNNFARKIFTHLIGVTKN